MRHRVFHHVWPALLLLGLALVDASSLSLTVHGQEVTKDPGQQDIEAEVARLLTKLKEQQDNRLAGQDVWARTIKELIELGPDATPVLSRTLIETPMEDRSMLRSIPFVLRGIGDRRAVPALVLTLLKCNASDGSDMGYNSNDPEILAFMRQHDKDLEDRDPDGYDWGRPINEVRTALNKLTGTEHGEMELCHIHGKSSTKRQAYLKQMLFRQCAERWAEWWEKNWRDHISSEAYSAVDLPEFDADGTGFELNRDVALTVSSSISNMLLESVFSKDPRHVFYDLDTGRYGTVHSRWKGSVDRDNERIISKWAISEGFDLMGTEIEVDGKTVYVLRLLAGEAWELPSPVFRKFDRSTAADLIKQGRPVEELMVVHDPKTEKPDYGSAGAFLAVTEHGTPCFVRLGVEVQDTTLQRGVPVAGDNELNPKGFRKGRRLGLKLLKEEGGE
jgi:hypothetical protein